MALCPSCNKFAALEMQEPEVNDVRFDLESKTISADVRIFRNSECCSEEMKEYTFDTEKELDAEQLAKVEEILVQNPEAEFEVEEAGVDQLEESGSRYKKSYYGYILTVSFKYEDKELFTVELSNKVQASGMDELT